MGVTSLQPEVADHSSASTAASSAGAGALGQLAEQVVVEHLARDRRRGLGAEAAVLDQHRQRDGRLVGRRVGDEQRVVAQVGRHGLRLVLGALLREHLRRAGLAGRDVLGAGEGARAGAFLVHADHGVLDDVDVLRFPVAASCSGCGSIGVCSPVRMSLMYLTRCGRNITPSLASVAVACASWIGV